MPTPARSASLVLAAAADAHGITTLAHAVSLGVPAGTVRRLAQPGGPLERMGRGVFHVRSMRWTPEARILGAQLVAGGVAAACRRSSAYLLGLDGIPADHEVDIWHPRPRSGPFRHCRSVVHPSALVDLGPFVHTDAVTTLCHLGAVVPLDVLEQAVESAIRDGLVSWLQLHGRLGWRGSHGLGALRQVLELRPAHLPPTESVLETIAWQLLRSSALLAMPVRQHEVRTADGRLIARLDLCWPELRLYLELDGAQHLEPEAVRHDHRRTSEISALLGWAPIRLGWDEVVRRPALTLRRIEAAYLAAIARRAA